MWIEPGGGGGGAIHKSKEIFHSSVTPAHIAKGNNGPNVDIERICAVVELAVGGPTFNFDVVGQSFLFSCVA